jgi:hypothetical protein
MIWKAIKGLLGFCFYLLMIGIMITLSTFGGVLIYIQYFGGGTCSELDFLETARFKFNQQREYINNSQTANYTCINYSKDFYLVMTEFGYDIEITGGYPEEKNRSGHMWNKVCFDYEPQMNYEGSGIKDFSNQYPRPLSKYWEGKADKWMGKNNTFPPSKDRGFQR